MFLFVLYIHCLISILFPIEFYCDYIQLSAGGSLVHPEKTSMLVTPICPHTLTSRPMILPSNIDLTIRIPSTSRAAGWVSFDGRNRTELKNGSSIIITASRNPFLTICKDDQTADWFQSLMGCLGWSERARLRSGLL